MILILSTLSFLFQKENESDASLLNRLIPGWPAGVWGVFWVFWSCALLACAIVGGKSIPQDEEVL